MYLPLTFGF